MDSNSSTNRARRWLFSRGAQAAVAISAARSQRKPPSKKLVFGRLIAGLFLLAASGCAHQQLPPDSFLMVQVISERLSFAKDVAQAKWAAGLPVRDREKAQEEAVVLRLVEQAYSAGLLPGAAQRLIRAQLEASSLEQERWMTQWNNGENLPQGATPDLEALRQKLDRLSSRILAEWAAIEGNPLPAAALKAQLVKDGYSMPAAAAAAAFTR